MASARVMFRRGDVVKGAFPRLSGTLRPKTHWAVVISTEDYNESHDHGVFALISKGVMSTALAGVYQIKDLDSAGCDNEAMVTPWLYTVEWKHVKKVGELPPFEFRQALERLREIVP